MGRVCCVNVSSLFPYLFPFLFSSPLLSRHFPFFPPFCFHFLSLSHHYLFFTPSLSHSFPPLPIPSTPPPFPLPSLPSPPLLSLLSSFLLSSPSLHTPISFFTSLPSLPSSIFPFVFPSLLLNLLPTSHFFFPLSLPSLFSLPLHFTFFIFAFLFHPHTRVSSVVQ